MSKAVVRSSVVSEVLDGDNYASWSGEIQGYLRKQHLWDVVKSDEDVGSSSARSTEWEQMNAVALEAIQSSCGTKTLSYIRGIREAKQAWLCLEVRFNKPQCNDEKRNFLRFKAIERSRADEENVDYHYALDDALSKRKLSDALDLCKKNPLLLTKTLPNVQLVLNEFINLGGSDHKYQEKVVEILNSVPSDYLLDCLNQRDMFYNTPLDVAVRVGAIDIASCLAQIEPGLLFRFGFSFDAPRVAPLAAAIGSHMKDDNAMANRLYDLTPQHFWTDDDGTMTATVITTCFQAENLDFALKLLRSRPEEFIISKDIFQNIPLCAAARAPHLFRRTYHHPFFPKYICEVLGPRLPLGWINFKISGMDFLIHLGNAIRDPSTHSQNKIEVISEAFFEAVKHENFYFVLMLINFIKPIVHFTIDGNRNMYMIAIAHRRAKLFSYFWDKRDVGDLDPSLSFDKLGNNLLHMVGALTPPVRLDRISKPALQMKRELMWFKEVEKLVPELVRKSRNYDGKTPLELFNESHMDLMKEAGKWMKESASSWAIVGPLIITIMFAAAFQVPGGSLQDKGHPVFLEEWLFKVYMVLVAISLFSATISVLKFLEILSANYEEEDFLASLRTYNVITGTLFLSLATMLVAFCMGLFLTLHGELAVFLPIAALATFLVGYIICTKLPLLAESLNFFTFEEVKIPFIKWRTSIFEKNIGHEVKLIFKMLNRRPTSR